MSVMCDGDLFAISRQMVAAFRFVEEGELTELTHGDLQSNLERTQDENVPRGLDSQRRHDCIVHKISYSERSSEICTLELDTMLTNVTEILKG